MFYIRCPYCEEHRDEQEFHRVAEANLVRPSDPDGCSDQEWGEYLYFRKNTRGEYNELWVHSVGCRKFFNIQRNTETYEILNTSPV
ncbi:MAG: sarcosine oxidase subunit delta [Cellvibrionales bacterium]|nr:sarcosine oxidase subunit delta [Cellvibrionales bacterium]